jgi:hypothetical protein
MKSDSQRTRREQQRLLEQGSRLELVSLLYSLTAEPQLTHIGQLGQRSGNTIDLEETLMISLRKLVSLVSLLYIPVF